MSNVLETFMFLFESNASETKGDIDGLDKSLDDVEGTADEAADSVADAGKQFLEMGKSALGAVAGIAALTGMIAGTITKARQLDELGKFSRTIGESAAEVNAWEEAIIRAGGTADGFRTSIAALNEKVVDASIKGTNEVVPFFNQLGVSIVDANGKARSMLDMLPDLADAFEGMSEAESAGIGKRLGLDQGTILLLQSGRREVEAMVEKQRALGVASNEAIEASEKFNDQMSDLKQVLGFSSQEMIVKFLPAVTAVIGVLTDVAVWMADHEDLVTGFFIAMGTAVSYYAIPPLITLAASVIAATWPFLAMGAAIAAVGAAFALVYEDIVAFMEGNESLIGKMLERWPMVGKMITAVVGTIKEAFAGISDIIDGIAAFFGFGGEVSVAQESINAAGQSSIGSQTSNSIQGGNTTSRSTSVQVGEIVVQTSEGTPEGIAKSAAGEMGSQIQRTIDNFDDGIAI